MNNLIIIGGGNSISFFPDFFDDIIGQDVMSINHAYKFLKHVPKFQISLDCVFWKNNLTDMEKLEAQGCQLIKKNDENLFCGQKRLTGIFALSYVAKYLKYDSVFLFGYDHGPVDGKTHFYTGIPHRGFGRTAAYLDSEGEVLLSVCDYNHFKEKNIFLVGQSNVKSFEKLTYDEFLERIN